MGQTIGKFNPGNVQEYRAEPNGNQELKEDKKFCVPPSKDEFMPKGLWNHPWQHHQPRNPVWDGKCEIWPKFGPKFNGFYGVDRKD